MKKILFFFFLFSCTNIYAATRTAVANGNWSTASTWGGTVPQAADIAVIPSGITVTLNTGVSGANTPWANPGAIKYQVNLYCREVILTLLTPVH